MGDCFLCVRHTCIPKHNTPCHIIGIDLVPLRYVGSVPIIREVGVFIGHGYSGYYGRMCVCTPVRLKAADLRLQDHGRWDPFPIGVACFYSALTSRVLCSHPKLSFRCSLWRIMTVEDARFPLRECLGSSLSLFRP